MARHEKIAEVERLVKSQLKIARAKWSAFEKGANRQLHSLQSQVINAVGVARQSQIRELNRELSRLSKRIDELARK
jgi:hypothetical protein